MGSAHRRRRSTARSDQGFSMVVTMVSLLIGAVLLAVLFGSVFRSGSNGSTAVTNAPGVGLAGNVQAQQSLSTGLTSAASAATAGGYSVVSPQALTAANPSISFVAGPSTSPAMVSVSVTTSAPGPGSGGVEGVGGVDSSSAVGGSVTLAALAPGGTCWLAWQSSQAGTWYGAQTGVTSCTAPAIASPPGTSPVSATSIGWQQGTFPQP